MDIHRCPITTFFQQSYRIHFSLQVKICSRKELFLIYQQQKTHILILLSSSLPLNRKVILYRTPCEMSSPQAKSTVHDVLGSAFIIYLRDSFQNLSTIKRIVFEIYTPILTEFFLQKCCHQKMYALCQILQRITQKELKKLISLCYKELKEERYTVAKLAQRYYSALKQGTQKPWKRRELLDDPA